MEVIWGNMATKLGLLDEFIYNKVFKKTRYFVLKIPIFILEFEGCFPTAEGRQPTCPPDQPSSHAP